MRQLICRQWTGSVPAELGDEYERYLLATGLQGYGATPGNRAALLLRRETDHSTEFQTLSLWDDVDSIKGFAGDDHCRALYYPEDGKYLLRRSRLVTHYDMVFGRFDRELF